MLLQLHPDLDRDYLDQRIRHESLGIHDIHVLHG